MDRCSSTRVTPVHWRIATANKYFTYYKLTQKDQQNLNRSSGSKHFIDLDQGKCEIIYSYLKKS